tara:strand:+ start:771 stop:1478 length:708 start_codon:yes stop_codon:yes gene_type:complete
MNRSTETWFGRRTKALFDAIETHTDGKMKPRVLSKADGYELWWERVAVWFVVLLYIPSSGWSKTKARERFNQSYITTFGDRIYWSTAGNIGEYDPSDYWHYALVRHECVHMLDEHRLGSLWYRLLYVAVLPILWTYRSRFEETAYQEQLLVLVETGRRDAALTSLPGIRRQFKTSAYGWMGGGERFMNGGSLYLKLSMTPRRMLPQDLPWKSEFEKIGFVPEIHPDARSRETKES